MFDHFRHQLMTRFIEPLGNWLDNHADTIVWVVFHRITRGIAAWMVALGIAALLLSQAWDSFDDPQRNDGNSGHCTIDFGGQWLMGAMLVSGHGRELYDRNYQRPVLVAHYPRDREDPKTDASDAEKLMSYFMGSDSRSAADAIASFALPVAAGDDAINALALTLAMKDVWTPLTLEQATAKHVGGPLYPPVNAFIYAPLGMMEPHIGYRVNQFMNLFWALVAALGVRYLSRGNIWTSVAMAIIVLYPGFKGSIHLGQNAALTLAIITWGWALIARDRPIAGGLVWGLLAFKPVWAASFFLVPLLTFRLRTCAAMLGMGAGLALFTLPFVGIQPWFDWLSVGKDAAELYKTDYNWVHLSRDVLGIPRRWLLDFTLPSARRDVVIPWVTRNTVFVILFVLTVVAVIRLRRQWRWEKAVLLFSLLALGWIDWLFLENYKRLLGHVTAGSIVGWSMFLGCLLLTVYLPLSRPRQARAVNGTTAGFLLMGAWLACFHFMYYDILLTVLPIFVLLAEPRSYLQPILFTVAPMKEPDAGQLADYYRAWPPESQPYVPALQPGFRNVWVLNRMVPNILALLLVVEHWFPRIGLAGTFTGMWLEPARIATMQDAEGNVLMYRKVADLASMRVSTAIYDNGQPFDTYLILFLFVWCACLWLGTPRMPAVREVKLPEPHRLPMLEPASEQIMER